MSIFVSIASYRDEQLSKTVDSLISNADNPQDLHLGIISQDVSGRHPNFDHIANVKQTNVHARDACGAGYARKLAMDLYDGEDYFFQIDSHMRFAKGWDTKLKDMLCVAQQEAETEKVILSQFPAAYFPGSDGKDYFITGDPLYWEEPSWTAVKNGDDGSWAGQRMKMENFDKPHKSHTILAGYVFTIGSIVEEVPYDERISFMGEELCFAIRAYTRGWEIYAPNEMLIWHYYKRQRDDKVWQNSSTKRSWFSIEKESHEVQKNVLLAKETGVFGVEDYDRYFDYQDMIGISFHDFYFVDKRSFKENMSLLIEEIDFFSDGPKTGYCISNLHEDCHQELCTCDCHEWNKDDKNT